MLALPGLSPSGWLMAAILFVILNRRIIVCRGPARWRRGRQVHRSAVERTRNINWLSGRRWVCFCSGRATCCLCGPFPIYFYAVLSDGSVESKRDAFFISAALSVVERNLILPQAGPRVS